MKFGQKMRVVYKQDFGRAIHKIVKKGIRQLPEDAHSDKAGDSGSLRAGD